MIDIKAIRAAAENHPSPWPMSLQPATVLALCDEIERLQKDAARYQWLKRECVTSNYEGELGIEFECGFDNWNDIDAAIDAEMESK